MIDFTFDEFQTEHQTSENLFMIQKLVDDILYEPH